MKKQNNKRRSFIFFFFDYSVQLDFRDISLLRIYMRAVCRDFVQCPYVIRERVLKTDIFQGVSPTCVLYLVLQRK